MPCKEAVKLYIKSTPVEFTDCKLTLNIDSSSRRWSHGVSSVSSLHIELLYTSHSCIQKKERTKRSSEVSDDAAANCNSGLLVPFRGCLEGELVLNGPNSILVLPAKSMIWAGTDAFQK